MPDTQISDEMVDIAARAVYAVSVQAIEPALGIPMCKFEELPERDLNLHRDYARAALQAALSGYVVGWRTMDSAPRDGTPFLAWESEDRGPFKCWWYFDWPHDEAYWTDYADSEPDPKYWAPIPAPPVQEMERG